MQRKTKSVSINGFNKAIRFWLILGHITRWNLKISKSSNNRKIVSIDLKDIISKDIKISLIIRNKRKKREKKGKKFNQKQSNLITTHL